MDEETKYLRQHLDEMRTELLRLNPAGAPEVAGLQATVQHLLQQTAYLRDGLDKIRELGANARLERLEAQIDSLQTLLMRSALDGTPAKETSVLRSQTRE